MEITIRDVLVLVGMLGQAVGLWVILDRKVTRLETLMERVKKLEELTEDLDDQQAETNTAVSVLTTQVTAIARDLGELKGQMGNGFRDLMGGLKEIQARVGGRRAEDPA